MPVCFPSKVDAWLAAIIGVSIVVDIGASAYVVVLNAPGAWFVAPLLLVVGALLPLWIFLSTDYRIDDERLAIRSGPFRWSIPLDQIASIQPTNNPLSSPALSLDRLEITQASGRTIRISPRDQAGFLAELNGRIERRGGAPLGGAPRAA